MIRPALLTLTLLISSPLPAYDFKALAAQHIIPSYAELAGRTQQLDRAISAHCAKPGPQSLDAAQHSFREAFLAWQSAQHLRLGPIQYLSREHRLQLWPDKRGTVGRHTRALLDDPELLASGFEISSKSVAVQGFSALEQLLFDAQPAHPQACVLMQAISANLSAIASDLLHDWRDGEQAYASYLADPGPLNPLFENEAELAGQLLNSLHTQLELIQTQKLGRPMGESPDKARGRRAEAWRSSRSLAAIERNLMACRSLYRLAFAPELHDAELAQQIEHAFGAVIFHLNEVDGSLDQAVEQPQQWQHLQRLLQTLEGLRTLIGRDMAAQLGLSLGFNSLDGD